MNRRPAIGNCVRARGPRFYDFAIAGYGSIASAVPTEKHHFSIDVSLICATSANIRDGVSSFGTWDVGVMASGYTTASTWIHAYATLVATVGTNLSNGTGRYGAGFGYALVGFSTLYGNVGIYTFESNTSGTGTTLGTSAQLWAAISGQDYAVIGGGYSTITATDRYRYSNNTRAAGTALGAGRYGLAGISGPVYGVFHGGYNLSVYVSSTDEYDNATGTRAAGTTAANPKQGCMGVADHVAGRLLGGQDGAGANDRVETYNWATKAATQGTRRISWLRNYGGAVSGCAPHLSTTVPV